MAGDNDKQEEIVLGNRQLLSIFFVVVILLGVAFTIGYMIGKNTTPVSAANAPAPLAETAPSPRTAAAAQGSSAETLPTPAPAEVPRVIGTHPAEPYTDAGKAAEPAPVDAKPAAGNATTPTPAGTYLQVVALKRGDADHMVKVLQDRGFPALLGESPVEGLFRVLVGPYKTMAEVAESKQKLRAAGFDPIVAR